MQWNAYQLHAMRTYANGEFAHLHSPADLKNCGDGLFEFVMSELATDQDCENVEEAVRRIDNAINDLLAVRRGLDEICDEPQPMTEAVRLYFLKRLRYEQVVIARSATGWTYPGEATVFASEEEAIRSAADAKGILLPDWDEVRMAYGLDESFQYSAEQMRDYTEAYIKADVLIANAMGN